MTDSLQSIFGKARTAFPFGGMSGGLHVLRSLDRVERFYLASVIVLLVVAPILFVPTIPEALWEVGRKELFASVLIFALPCLLAALAAAGALVMFSREQEVLERVRRKVNDDRKAIDVRTGKLAVSDIVPERYLPRWAEGMVSERLVELLIKNAKALRRDSDTTTQVFLRELSTSRMALRPWQAVALRLGILFTFIGLLFGLEPIATAMTSDTRLNFATMIEGLTIAFATSIAGLSAALVIQFMIFAVDHRFARLATALEIAWMDLGELLAHMRFEGNLPATVDQLSSMIRDHREELAVHRNVVREQIDRVVDAANDHGQRINRATEGFGKTSERMERLEREHHEHVSRLAGTLDSVKEYEERWTQQFTTLIDETLARQEAVADSQRSMLQEGFGSLERQVLEERPTLERAVSVLTKCATALQESVDAAREQQASSEQRFERVHDALVTLARTLERENENGPQPFERHSFGIRHAGALTVLCLVLLPTISWLVSGRVPWAISRFWEWVGL